MEIILIDYDRGNLRSVEKALQRTGVAVRRVCGPEEWGEPDAVVLPGVGAFGDAMANLVERGLVAPLRAWLGADRPFLGICLGYQLLFTDSEESPGVAGLGWREGTVRRFPDTVGTIPHMGWNRVEAGAGAGWLRPVFSGGPFFYHVHSYYPDGLVEGEIASLTEYNGLTFASGICRGNVCAFQFHPEKSQENGHRLLQAFVQRTAAACPVPAPA